MASRNTPCWEAPKFSFTSQNQAEDRKQFYTRVLAFLKTLDINPDEEDQGKKGWCQIKMMFEGDDCQALQTLINNNTISPDAQHTPILALNAVQSVVKRMCTSGITTVKSCLNSASCLMKPSIPLVPELTPQLANVESIQKRLKKPLRLCYYGMQLSAMEWGTGCVCKIKEPELLVPPSALQLEACCEQFQQAQAQGRAHLTTIILASANQSSLHANAQWTTTHQSCFFWCGKSQPQANCPVIGQECYNCHGTGHFTALCRRPCPNRHPANSFNRSQWDTRGRFHRSSSHLYSSRLPSRCRQSCRSLSHSSHHSISSSCSPSQDSRSQRRPPHHRRWSSTPYRH